MRTLLLGRDQYPLMNGPRGKANGENEENGSNECQLLELRVPEGGTEDTNEVDGTSTITNEMTDCSHPASCISLASSLSRNTDGLPHAEPVCCLAIGRVSTIKLRLDDCTIHGSKLLFANMSLFILTCIDCKIDGVDTENSKPNSAGFGL